MWKHLAILLTALNGYAASVSITATNMGLESTDWVNYSTAADSPQGAWLLQFNLTNSVPITLNLGETLDAGNYSAYVEILNYDGAHTFKYTVDGTDSLTQTLDDRDADTIYWTTNTPVTASSSFSSVDLLFTKVGNVSNPRLFNFYITDDTNTVVLRDGRALTFLYPSAFDTNAAVGGNYVPDSSFEARDISFWRNVLIGNTNDLRTMYSTTYAYHGNTSIKLQSTNQNDEVVILQSNPLLLASNKQHTASVWIRADSASSRGTIRLTSMYDAPTGQTETFTTNASTTVGTTWTQLSVTANIPWYPNGEVFVTLEHRDESGGAVYFDSLMVAQGTNAVWEPKEDFELGFTSVEPTRIFYNAANTNDITVRLWNNTASESTKVVNYEIVNWTNVVVQDGTLNITAGSSNLGTATLTAPTNWTGHFRGRFWMDGINSDTAYNWLMISPPTSGINTNSQYGAHINGIVYPLERAQRLGIKWSRALSTLQSLGRWSVVESTENTFNYIEERVRLFTNFGVRVLGVLGENLPTWQTGMNHVYTTNVAGGPFQLGEEVRGTGATGLVSYITYSTNATGTSLQLTNLTGANFSSGSVTGQTSGAEADIRGTVSANVLQFDKWTDFVTNMFDHYRSDVLHWEIWNEPDQDTSEIPDLAQFYAEVLRIAAIQAKSWGGPTIIGAGGVQTATLLNSIYNALGVVTNDVHGWSVHQYPEAENNAEAVKDDFLDAHGGTVVHNTETGVTDKGSYVGFRANHRSAGTYAIPWKSGDRFYDTLYQNQLLQMKNLLTCLGEGQSQYYYYDYGQRSIEANDLSSRQFTGLDHDHSSRVKMAAVTMVMRLLDGATSGGELVLADSDSTAFSFDNGGTPYVAFWGNSVSNKTITLSGAVSAGDLLVRDVMGNPAVPASLSLQYGRMPLIVEGTGAVTEGNLQDAFTNGTIVARSDTLAPTLSLTVHPRASIDEQTDYVLRWLAIDDMTTPSETAQSGVTYRYSLAGGGWSEWSGLTYLVVGKGQSWPAAFIVQAMDSAGNLSQADFNVPDVPQAAGNLRLEGNLIFK